MSPAEKKKPPRICRDGAAHETESGHEYGNDSKIARLEVRAEAGQ